jgi:hypothetical protein
VTAGRSLSGGAASRQREDYRLVIGCLRLLVDADVADARA